MYKSKLQQPERIDNKQLDVPTLCQSPFFLGN